MNSESLNLVVQILVRRGALALFAFGVLILQPAFSSGQGTVFNYQGRLNQDGAPVTGQRDFEFRLFDAASGGFQQGATIILDDLGVTNGLFTATLDFGAAVFPGADRFLQIAIRSSASTGDYTNLSPRQPITSTPYAIRAGHLSGPVAAGQITGTISSNNIGVGTISGAMLANGTIGSSQLATGAVTTTALADGAVTATKVAALAIPLLLTTFTNPTPALGDGIGSSVASVGTDRVLIGVPYDDAGAYKAGAAYLFGTNGTLLTTFTNPTPTEFDFFGGSVAVVGTDRVLIGSQSDDTGAGNAGAAYLFSTSGALLATFTNPAPATDDFFGYSVAAVGTNRVLISAPFDDTGASQAGAAYLFSTTGALLTTFTNPTPAANDNFGYSVAALGTDRVLIGAYRDDTGASDAGAAYLFRTNGTLLTTFTNPAPAASDNFGYSVAVLGTDRVLIGAQGDDAGAVNAGAAYLFLTNGTLLTTFTNPAPAASDLFGYSVAALGTDRVLIGALQDQPSATYLFSANGTLLTTFTKPTPLTGGLFGYSVATLGTDRVLIGTLHTGTVAGNAGVAYLFRFDMFSPGLVADGVKPGSITTASMEDGAVTLAKLDPTLGVWTRSGDDVFRVTGNVGIGTSSFTSNRLQVAGIVGATAFNTTSDRATKQDFTAVDKQTVLAKLVALPITQWRFKDFPGVLHLGPTAQDFQAAFGLGVDDKSIATVDADGVALAAIQGLNQKLEETRAELKLRNAESAALKRRLQQLEQLVESISSGTK